MKKKLIEVALPLEKINAESAREKSIRHGHPSTLHLWWARRPLAAARAVIWASIVDDPSSHPEEFQSEEQQLKERQRLFGILEDLVTWEKSNDKNVIDAARKEIIKSTNGNPPSFLDPFAGGGAIPLEAQRLGLEANAHDLNPVAVLLNKAMIEIPPKFSDMSPVNPDDRVSNLEEFWSGNKGIAADIRYYGAILKRKAEEKIGKYYPKVQLPRELGGKKATVIAWIWTRTVKCQNPACSCDVPMSRSFVLSNKKGAEAWIEPIYNPTIEFRVNYGKCPKDKESNKEGPSASFRCLNCGEITTPEYVKSEAINGRMEYKMMAVIAEGDKGRVFVSPDKEQILAVEGIEVDDYPDGLLSEDRRAISPPAYGMERFSDLFSKRQLLALTTFCDLIEEVRKSIEDDAIRAGLNNDNCSIDSEGIGALAYSQAVSVYLTLGISRMSSYWSNITTHDASRQKLTSVFARQAIPMAWDYMEANPFCGHSGDIINSIEIGSKAIERLPIEVKMGRAIPFDARQDCGLNNIMVSMDPPYYDNIGYADLSDFFYIWMRRCLKATYPELFSTILVPKNAELVAIPYRHEGNSEKAKAFFEDGMYDTCKQIREHICDEIPLTIFYAYKQSDSDEKNEKEASTGWETMLSAVIKAGFIITGTWPMRTEMSGRARARGANALASSIVLVCRKRMETSSKTTRRNLIAILRRELRDSLRKLQQSNIAPVDLAQSAIGPGMAVFSRYTEVLEADGTPMTVRSALQVINEEIDLFFNEQVGELDTSSRFCVDLYTQNAYNDVKFGEAEVLANAKGASIPLMASKGYLYAKAGNVHLIERDKLSERIDDKENNVWLLTQQLTRAMETGGIEACANIVFSMFGSNAERAKDLAYRLYTIAEQKKWTNEAYAYNSLVVAWPDIQSRAAALKTVEPKQMTLFDMNGEV